MKNRTKALKFVILLGIVSLCADATYEGGRSIAGVYLGVLAGLRHFLWSKKASKVYIPVFSRRFGYFLDISGFERFFGC